MASNKSCKIQSMLLMLVAGWESAHKQWPCGTHNICWSMYVSNGTQQLAYSWWQSDTKVNRSGSRCYLPAVLPRVPAIQQCVPATQAHSAAATLGRQGAVGRLTLSRSRYLPCGLPQLGCKPDIAMRDCTSLKRRHSRAFSFVRHAQLSSAGRTEPKTLRNYIVAEFFQNFPRFVFGRKT